MTSAATVFGHFPLVLVSGGELFHRADVTRPSRKRLGRVIDSFLELREGDYVEIGNMGAYARAIAGRDRAAERLDSYNALSRFSFALSSRQ